MSRSKKLLFTLFILPFSFFGQDYLDTYDLIYGYLNYKNSFYGQTLSPTHCIGLGIADHHVIVNTAGLNYSGGYAGNYFLPRQIMISDSTKAGFSGFSFSFDFGYMAFRGVKNFRLFIYSGFITGNNYLKFDNSTYRNPYFSPKLCIKPKLFLGKFSLAVSAGYNYDISKTHWMRRKGESYRINGFDQTCMNFQFHLGFRPW